MGEEEVYFSSGFVAAVVDWDFAVLFSFLCNVRKIRIYLRVRLRLLRFFHLGLVGRGAACVVFLRGFALLGCVGFLRWLVRTRLFRDAELSLTGLARASGTGGAIIELVLIASRGIRGGGEAIALLVC